MDKNTIYGLVMIGVILIGFQYFSTNQAKKNFDNEVITADSLFKAANYTEAKKAYEKAAQYNPKSPYPKQQLIVIAKETGNYAEPSTQNNQKKTPQNSQGKSANKKINAISDTAVHSADYGLFEHNNTKEKLFTLENNKVKITFTNKGAKPLKVMLKEYKTYTQQDLYLLDGKGNFMALNFYADNKPISTDNLLFNSMAEADSIVVDSTKKSIKFRLYADSKRYIEFVYTLLPDEYMLKFNVNFIGMNDIIAKNVNFVDLYWRSFAPAHERGRNWEEQNTTIYYQYYKDQVDYLSERSDEKDADFTTRVKWIAFKQQFFSSILVADKYFEEGKVQYKKIEEEQDPEHLMEFYSELSIPYNPLQDTTLGFKFYFGPNKYSTLKEYNTILGDKSENLQTEHLVPLGWTIFRWINKWAIIPLFNFLGTFITNYGLIILIMTVLIKLVLFPFTYKSYVSSARMRVLKPEIDAINAKIPKDKAMERQKATMALYKKAGVNPMGGCLPMVFQFPILIALYRFFPSSIELRQKSFLWATDLSTYDSIWHLPFQIPMYGDHVSLFTLLMAIVMVISTKMNASQMEGSSNQIPGMKTMMYMMPLMMVVWFNNYSAGLSYYYFLSTSITILQTYFIRKTVNDEEILRKIHENKKKPVKKSRFQERMDKLQKQQAKNKKR